MRRIRKPSIKQCLLSNVTALFVFTGSLSYADVPIRYEQQITPSLGVDAKATTKVPQRIALNLSANDDVFFYPDERIDVSSGKDEKYHPPAQPEILVKSEASQPVEQCHVDPVHYESYAKIGNAYTIDGVTYTPSADPFYEQSGTASWYGADFHGKPTANGETYDMMALTAAHPTLPLPSYVLVENLSNGLKVVVRVNDRGPFKKNRIIDLSKAAARQLDMIAHGTTDVRVEYLGPAEKAGDKSACSNLDLQPKQHASIDLPKKEPQVQQWKASVSEAHFVQIGSFANRDNARALLSEAQTHVQKGDVVFANVNGSGRYRVVLGPFKSRSDADTTLSVIKSKGFNGLVVKNPSL